MKFRGLKLILIFTFVVFLMHGFIPHMHFDDHIPIYLTEHTEAEEGHHGDHDEDTAHLSQHLDDVFISKKPLNSPFQYKVASFINTILQYDLQAEQFGRNILINKPESLPQFPVTHTFSLRAPPVV